MQKGKVGPRMRGDDNEQYVSDPCGIRKALSHVVNHRRGADSSTSLGMMKENPQ